MTRLERLRELERAAKTAPWVLAYPHDRPDIPVRVVMCGVHPLFTASVPDADLIADARNALPDLLAVAEAARILHAGLTCPIDPMDVDERIANLGKALAPLAESEA